MASTRVFNPQILVLLILLLKLNCFALLGQCARLLQQNTEEGGSEDLVTSTCKHTLYFQVCVSSLRSVSGSNSASDPKTLAGIALNLSTTYATKTLSYVCELRSYNNGTTTTNNNNNSYMFRCLSDCEEEYSEAIGNLQDSAEALANGEYDKVDTLVSAAMSDAETCEDGFKDNMLSDDNNNDSSNYSSLSERNRYFSELCSNALAITKLLV